MLYYIRSLVGMSQNIFFEEAAKQLIKFVAIALIVFSLYTVIGVIITFDDLFLALSYESIRQHIAVPSLAISEVRYPYVSLGNKKRHCVQNPENNVEGGDQWNAILDQEFPYRRC